MDPRGCEDYDCVEEFPAAPASPDILPAAAAGSSGGAGGEAQFASWLRARGVLVEGSFVFGRWLSDFPGWFLEEVVALEGAMVEASLEAGGAYPSLILVRSL